MFRCECGLLTVIIRCPVGVLWGDHPPGFGNDLQPNQIWSTMAAAESGLFWEYTQLKTLVGGLSSIQGYLATHLSGSGTHIGWGQWKHTPLFLFLQLLLPFLRCESWPDSRSPSWGEMGPAAFPGILMPVTEGREWWWWAVVSRCPKTLDTRNSQVCLWPRTLPFLDPDTL